MAESDAGVASKFSEYEQHLVTGGELLRQDRVDDAQREFLRALELMPGDLKALGLLGLACFRLQAFDQALPVYEQLVALKPDDASYRLNLGLVHLKLGSPDEAISQLQRSRDLDPSQTRAVSYLGLAYARNGKYGEAYQAFLQGGQKDLAREMEQYLSESERAVIARAISAAGALPAEVEDDEEINLDDDSGVVVIEADEPESGVHAVAEPSLANKVDPPNAVVSAPIDGPSVITAAVDNVVPSSAATGAATRVAPGHRAPQSLSEFATARLVRPSDGDHPFEISAGGVLIVRVDGQVYSRMEGVDVTGGELAYEHASRRVRGKNTDEPFAIDGRELFIVSGKGHLIAAPLGAEFTAVTLDDDVFYLREELVFAFERELRWENGQVPGSEGRINMVQFRGRGAVAFRTDRPLLAVKLGSEQVLYVDADVLAGWIGRVVPRTVKPAGGGRKSAVFVECTGEGVVLVHEAHQLPAAASRGAAD